MTPEALSPPASSLAAALARRAAQSATIGGMAFLTLVDLFAAQAILPSLATRYAAAPAAESAGWAACAGGAIAALGVAAALATRFSRASQQTERG